MPQLRPFRAALVLIAALALPVKALADQTDKATFSLEIKGLSAGRLTFSGKEQGGSYAVAGRLESAGLVSLIRKIRYDARAHGRVSGTVYTPSRYEEDADTGKRQSQSVMEYRGGVPQVKVYNPPRDPRPGDVDPASQGGTVDPLTALYATLRDVPRDQACNLTLTLFDGRRRSQLVLAPAEAAGDAITCAGEYRRLAGFSEKDMAEKSRFPFRLIYEDAGNGTVRVSEVTMDSLYGKARLKRR
ncbi:MAG: DUF3108 domain-containing protein [Paracoccaceae bacterium]